MKSPFKFLDAFGPGDKEVFFGREEEVAALYDMVAKNRLILVYGQSGTGKTSLIQCGLAGRFDATDWFPVQIRRQNDLNQSLRERLRAIVGGAAEGSLPDALEEIYVNFLRPVYLIFDQLEELFILGDAKEQGQFIASIRALLDSSVPCRVLFVIREEYLAHLYGFERVVPTLFDRRLRVEPMSAAKVKAVLAGSFDKFKIKVLQPQSPVFEQIIENVSGGRAGVQLPYLQVYLDILYREDFARTYPGESGARDANGHWRPVEFSPAEIGRLGKIENVLEKFLREQQSALQADLKRRFPAIEDDAVAKVLDAFVSAEGTKRPIGFVRRGEILEIEKRWASLFQPLDMAFLTACCAMLEQSRLLRIGDESMELAHDALAQIIDNQRSEQQRRLNDALNRLLNGFKEHGESGEFLSKRQLNRLEEYLPLLTAKISPEVKKFVAESQAQAERLEKAELEAERQKRRQARRVAIVGLALAAAALTAFAIAFVQYRAAESAKIRIAREALTAQLQFAKTLKIEGKYGEAIRQIADCQKLATELDLPEEAQSLKKTGADWQQIQVLTASGDSLARVGDLRATIEKYELARALEGDARLENVLRQTRLDLETKFQEYSTSGQALLNARQFRMAAEAFEKALRLKPEDAATRRKLEEAGR